MANIGEITKVDMNGLNSPISQPVHTVVIAEISDEVP